MSEKTHLDIAFEIAAQAGILIKSAFYETLNDKVETEWKGDNSPLTKIDLAINDLVLREVIKHFPTHSIISEEGSMEQKSDYVWVCDPIDGTLPFSKHIPTCVFSLTLVYQGNPIMAVVLDPFLDRLFHAEKGKGAFLNGKPIHVSTATTLENSAIGIYLWSEKNPHLGILVESLLDKKLRLIDAGSSTYMGCLVASGELVASITNGKKAHDSAAVKIIVEEAGGKVLSILGSEQPYDTQVYGHVTSNGILHNQIQEVINAAL